MLSQAYRAAHEGRAGWKIKFEYDADTIERLKANVPHTERAWNDEHKWWWVSDRYQDVVLVIFPDFEAYLKQLSMF